VLSAILFYNDLTISSLSIKLQYYNSDNPKGKIPHSRKLQRFFYRLSYNDIAEVPQTNHLLLQGTEFRYLVFSHWTSIQSTSL